MQNGEFEKNVQQKMEELRFTPSATVWDKVEQSLPEKEKQRRWLFFILLFCFLAGVSFLLWNKYNNGKEKIAESKTATQTSQGSSNAKIENTTQTIADSNSTVITKQQTTESTDKNDLNANAILENTTQEKTSIKITAANGTAIITDDNVAKANHHSLKTKSKTKIKITTSNPTAIITDDGVAKANSHLSKTKSKTHIKVRTPNTTREVEENNDTTTGIVSSEKLIDSNKIVVTVPLADSAVAINKKTEKDTLSIQKDTATSVTKAKEKKVSKSKWIYEIEGATGLSNIKADLFDAAAPPLNYSASTGTITNPQSAIRPAATTKNVAFSFGFYAEKALDNNWKFTTGLNYVYQSNALMTGIKQDSSRVFIFGSNSISTNGGYYLTGNSSTYKNKYHLLEIPLLMEYSFSKKSPFYLQGGTTVGYLLQSNALVYNAGYNQYFTDAALFNKLIVSFTLGGGINLAQKTKLPFSIGYRFKYGVNSAVKKSFGEQHFVNSLLYIKIPLKK